MPTTSQLRLPPILDESLFEDFCRDLWSTIWKDPDAKRNGRKGQSQCGVDVFGLPAEEKQYEGLQAKAYTKPLTTAELQHEIDEAKKFTPPLRKLIIAYTGPRDATSQAYVRQINLDHRASHMFSVSLISWEDIKQLVQTHWVPSCPDLVEKYFEVATTSGALLAGLTEAVETAVTRTISNSASSMAIVDVLPHVLNQEHYHVELNYARKLVNEAKPQQALAYLSSCWERMWNDAKAAVRYRLLHYKGCTNCLLENSTEAGRLFVEAVQYNPDDDMALAFAALGALMLEDNENAARYASQALARNPSNGKAYATLVHTLDESLPFETLVETVPEAYRRLPEAANALANLARSKGLMPEAEQWCRLAIEQDRENWADPHGVLGEILMQRALADGPLLPSVGISGTKREQMEEAEAAFTSAWERVAATEINSTRTSWLINRGAIRLLLGRPMDASEDFDAALRLNPGDPMLILRRAHLAVQEGETAQAIALLQRVPLSPENADLALMLAELLVEVDQYDDAARTLDRLLTTEVTQAAALSAERIRLRIAINRKDWPRAQQRYTDLRSKHPDNTDVMVDGAWLFRLIGDRQSGLALLTEATSLLVAAGPATQHILAMEWYEYGEFREAARFYGKLADLDVDSPLTRRLLLCFYYSADLGEALGLAQRMISLHGPLPVFSPVAVAVLDEAGDLQNAKRIAEDYLALFPNDFDIRLRLASVLQRSGDTEGVDAFLDSPINIGSLTMPTALRIASLYAYRIRLKQALQVAYEVRRQHFGESEAHAFYVSLFLEASKDSHEDDPAAMCVGVDTAVCLRDDEGKDEWHIIEEREDHRLPMELPPSHTLARKLWGLSAGTKILLTENDFSTETATVIVVLSKYAYALQQSMHTFERMFPDASGLWKIKLPTVEDAPDGSELDFDPFFRMITRHHEHGQSVERLYKEGKLPLGVFAKLMGDGVIQTWSRAVSRADLGIRCSQGVPGEIDSARRLLAVGTSLVLEPVALLTLYRLDTRDTLSARFGQFAITQSLIDMIQRERQGFKGMKSNGFVTVGKDGEQFVQQEVTQEDIQGNIDY